MLSYKQPSCTLWTSLHLSDNNNSLTAYSCIDAYIGLRCNNSSVFVDGRLSTHADPTLGQRAGRIGKRTGRAYDQAPIRIAHSHISHFGLLGEQSSPKWEIPCPERRWTTVQNLTPLALSPAEKSVTVQTKNSNRPCLSACVDKNRFVDEESA